MSEMMKAVRLHGYGGPEALVYADAPQPSVGAQDVLVRVHAAGINPVDWKTRAGQGVAPRVPADGGIVGWDVSGTVVARGADAGAFALGDAVYGMVQFPEMGAAYAEYVSAPAAHLAHKPAAIDHVAAASVPLAALTAWQALFDTAQLQPGQTVLIHAAAGGVGHLAVQLAKWRGARVIGTASAHNAGFLRELGVDQAIDYTSAAFEQAAGMVDVVLDTVGGSTLERSFAVVRPGGILTSIVAHPAQEQAATHGIRAQWVFVHTDGPALAQIASLIDAGHVRPYVSATFPLAQARDAHALGELRRTRGKIVLRVAEE